MMETVGAIVGFFIGIFKFLIFLALVGAGVALWGYNTLRRLSEEVRTHESGIGVITSRQIVEVNQLLEISTKVQESEKFTHLKISDDMNLSNVGAVQERTSTILSGLSQMAQRFPELRSNEQFDTAMRSVRELGGRLEAKRLEYNEAVKVYNTQRSSIPHVFYSSLLGFRPGVYLDASRIKNEDSMNQPMMVHDDGERINQLLLKGSAAAMGAGRQLGAQAKLFLDKASSKPSALSGAQYLYLDANKAPHGPVDVNTLRAMVESGMIPADTQVFHPQKNAWVAYREIQT